MSRPLLDGKAANSHRFIAEQWALRSKLILLAADLPIQTGSCSHEGPIGPMSVREQSRHGCDQDLRRDRFPDNLAPRPFAVQALNVALARMEEERDPAV